ncbi:MAG: polyribonucleotide nucleotidyltransferase [bacterium]|nr:polyribonucleotide nucleotidyltransferase [bacterium]
MNEKVEVKIGDRDLIIETGKLAKQADGAVTVRCGDTIILATVVCSKTTREGMDYFPLSVDYREKTYAAGKIPGGFFKREGRPTEKEILTSRLIDRPIRPLFPDMFRNELQIMIAVLSADEFTDPDVLAMVGASAAMGISDIPFFKPIGAVRIGRINGEFIINPSYEQIEQSELAFVVAGTKDAITMVEGDGKGVSEEVSLDALKVAHTHIVKITEVIEELIAKCGKTKRTIEIMNISQELESAIKELAVDKILQANKMTDRSKRRDLLDNLLTEIKDKLSEKYPEQENAISYVFDKIEKEEVRRKILDDGKRIDGRSPEEIRPITCEIGVLPRTHGSAVFTRGETQSLAVTTLGTSEDGQRIDGLRGDSEKTFMLHYNFPAFSVGEARPNRGPGRREIGHGALAERAIRPVMPSSENFPYTVRIVSDILESNGSSSMATVCGGVLSLMDAGVPIKESVAGVAMGLIKEEDRFVVLTDISGLEDHIGDMDFKVTGTREGITAFQMDIKMEGITHEIMGKCLSQAKEARLKILDKMADAISEPRKEVSLYAPRIFTMQVNTDKIGKVIGPGGKTIKKIVLDTGVKIDIDDQGKVSIASADKEQLDKAIDIVKKLVEDVEVGKTYDSVVKKVTNFGAFAEVLPGQEGLIHVSQLSNAYIKNVDDVVKVGDKLTVKVMEIDSQGRINLSRKAVMDEEKQDN